MNLDLILADISNEVKKAEKKFKPFNSPHEGLAVIQEEFHELMLEVFKKKPEMEKMYTEAMQTAAMCVRFAKDLVSDHLLYAPKINIDDDWNTGDTNTPPSELVEYP